MLESENLSPAPLSRIPFSAKGEASLRALCNWMQIAAVFSILGAVSKAITAFTPRQDFGKLFDAIITFLIGIFIYQAGTAFRKVLANDTADQRNLMEGFRLLRRVFLMESILVIISLALLAVVIAVVLLIVATRPGGVR